MRLKIIGSISDIETIASGSGVRIREFLNKTYGKGRWRKLKGKATVELADGTVRLAEIHCSSALVETMRFQRKTFSCEALRRNLMRNVAFR